MMCACHQIASLCEARYVCRVYKAPGFYGNLHITSVHDLAVEIPDFLIFIKNIYKVVLGYIIFCCT